MTSAVRKARRRAALAPALLAALTLAACGGDDAGDDATATAAGATATGPVAITDDTGKRVALDQPAERVVAIEWEAAENVLALGVTPVGAGDKEIYRDWVAAGKPLPAQTASVGTRGEASLEKIASLKPDLIVAGRDGIEKSRRQLEQIAPVAVFDIAPEPGSKDTEWDRMRTEVERLGTLLGRSEQATELLAGMDATIAEQAERIEAAGVKGQSVALVQAFTDGKPSARLFDDGAQLVELVHRLGLRNAYDGKPQRWGITSAGLEDLRKVAGADWLLTLALPEDDPFTGAWAKNPAYRSFDVVERGQVVPLGGDTWTWGGPLSVALAARRIADAVTGEAKPYS